jgi:hypothetical protein
MPKTEEYCGPLSNVLGMNHKISQITPEMLQNLTLLSHTTVLTVRYVTGRFLTVRLHVFTPRGEIQNLVDCRCL